MSKNLLPTIMYRKYDLPKVTALAHATLLVVLLSSVVLWIFNFMTTQLVTSYDDSNGIVSFNQYILSNNAPLIMASGLFLGLNGLVIYLLFRLRKKHVAYSMSALVVALQVTIIGSGMTML